MEQRITEHDTRVILGDTIQQMIALCHRLETRHAVLCGDTGPFDAEQILSLLKGDIEFGHSIIDQAMRRLHRLHPSYPNDGSS